MSNKKQPEDLQTIDPTTLGNVTGGTSSASSDVTAALTSVLDSLSSLKNQQGSGGMDPTMMMMMMMMMGGHNNAPAVVAAPAGTIGGYAGYTVDGVYYPFK